MSFRAPLNDMMFVLGQSARSGPRAGIAASLGIATGSLIHLALVAAGIAVLLAKYPVLFDAIRYAGAAYLVWLAWKSFRSTGMLKPNDGSDTTNSAAWRDGMLVNTFNPKTIIFLFAFLPPFIHPENGNPLLQLAILGMIFNIGGTLINFVAALSAGALTSALKGNFKLARGFAWLSGTLFLVLAARLAFSRH